MTESKNVTGAVLLLTLPSEVFDAVPICVPSTVNVTALPMIRSRSAYQTPRATMRFY